MRHYDIGESLSKTQDNGVYFLYLYDDDGKLLEDNIILCGDIDEADYKGIQWIRHGEIINV